MFDSSYYVDAEATPATFETPDLNARQDTPLHNLPERAEDQRKRKSAKGTDEEESKKGNLS